jgi:outer membrane lipopolysaccharide assembly protein LptE/RlpB
MCRDHGGEPSARAGAVRFRLASLILAAATLVATGCGYHTAGKAVRIPPDVTTISIPMFVSQTKTYRIEQIITNDVVHEFASRTRYHIVSAPGDDVDATLQGTVLTSEVAPSTADSQTGRATTAIVTVTASVKLVDRHGKVLYENDNYTFRDQYELSADPASFFEEDSMAMRRLSADFARTLVSNVLEAF